MPPNFEFGGFRSRPDGEDDELADYVCDGTAHRAQLVAYSRTYIVFDERNQLVGYCSLLADALKLEVGDHDSNLPEYESAPAIKIARLAVSVVRQGAGYGQAILDWVVREAATIGRRIGVRFITLESVPDKVSWYQSYGFALVTTTLPSAEATPESGERAMRLDLGRLSERRIESEYFGKTKTRKPGKRR